MVVKANLFFDVVVLVIKEGPYDFHNTMSFGQWCGGVPPAYQGYLYDILRPKLNKGFRFDTWEEAQSVCEEYNKHFADNDEHTGRRFIVEETLERIKDK